MKTYYVVHKGVKPGIYSAWNECKKQVDKFEGAIFKKFTDPEEAGKFLVNGFGQGKKPRIVTRRENDDKKNDNKILEQQEDIGPKIFVYTDGSCIKQKNKISVAGYGIYIPDKNIKVSKPLLNQKITNNRAEMTAIIESFKYLDQEELHKKICILTDSQYSMYIFNGTGERYEKNGYKNDGKDVPNIDLIKKILELKRSHDVILLKVRAHTGKDDVHSKYNEIADKLANSGALSTLTSTSKQSNNSEFKNLMVNIENKQDSESETSDIDEEIPKRIFFKKDIKLESEDIIDSDDDSEIIDENVHCENIDTNIHYANIDANIFDANIDANIFDANIHNANIHNANIHIDKNINSLIIRKKNNNKLSSDIKINQLFEFDEIENSESLDNIMKSSTKGKTMKNIKLSNWFIKKK
jgi:ribonuclease HI